MSAQQEASPESGPQGWGGVRTEVLLVLGVAAFLFLFRLGAFGLVGADEPRYAQIARDMLARHDWITPILYGKPWLEKPVGYYWAAIVSFKIFGVSDAAARLPSGLFAALMVWCTYGFLKKLKMRMSADAALMVASSVLIIGFARAASTDMMLAASFSIAMLAWFGWRMTGGRWWLAVFYGFMGIGMLAKGPVAPFLAILVIVGYCAVMRDWRSVLKTLWAPGIVLFVAIVAPWFVLIQMRLPEFFHIFIFEHNLERFGSNLFRHKQPFWYYVPVLLLATMPWTVIFVAAIVDGVRKWKDRVAEGAASEGGFNIFLLLWIALPVAFFSISHSKLPGYILPAIPPCLILAADYMHRCTGAGKRLPFWMAGFHAMLLALLAGAIMISPALLLKVPASVASMMMAGIVGTVVLVGMLLALFTRGWGLMRFATLVPVILLVGFVLRSVSPVINISQSARPVAKVLRETGISPQMDVATFKGKRELAYGLTFYLNRPVTAYEGLEISPNVYTLPAEVPPGEHVVVIRRGAIGELQNLLPGRTLRPLGFFRPQRLDFYQVSPAN